MKLVIVLIVALYGIANVAGEQCTGQSSSGATVYCYGSNSCCGDYFSRTCCSPSSGTSGGTVAGSVMGSLIFLAIIIGIIYCCVKGCPCCENPNHTVITTPGYVSHVHQPPPVHISYQNAPPQMQPPPYGAQNCNPMYPPQHGHHQEYQHNVQPAPAYNPNY